MKLKLIFAVYILSFSTFSFCAVKDSSSVINYSLNSNWQFRESDSTQWYPADVPGCVHTDLMNNKLIGDPFYGLNEQNLQWIGKVDWDYQSTFNVPDSVFSKKNIELIFEGLDTYADVYLNDSLILSAENMFRTWKIPCKKLLRHYDNLLWIHFKNVFEVNMPKIENAPFKLLNGDNNDQSDTMSAMYARKAQFHFGWDWGPRLITCGIWRNVFIQAWNDFKIENVQVIQNNVSKAKADITTNINIKSTSDEQAVVNVKVDGKNYASVNYQLIKGENKIPVSFEIDNPNLWWTNGLGSHYLYTFIFNVKSESGEVDADTEKIGIRSLRVVREKDKYGISFYVELNGVPVFMKGANYVPQDNFQNRVTAARYEHMIKSAADAHMNILRVWGGGIYEDNEFYNLCDQYGILVWQEFAFACAMYPSDSLFLNNVKYEVIDNVTRLRNHACLALYCGNNEDVIGWYNWGWKPQYTRAVQQEYEHDMDVLYKQVIPGALHKVDTTRYYHYTSPSAGFLGITNSEGDIHYWGVWHGKQPFSSFNDMDNIARFVSEYGFQSYPEINTIKKFAAPEDMQLHSAVMLSHQRCMAEDRKDKEYGNRLIQWYMERWFKQPKNFDMYVYVSQLLQAEGDKVAMEAHRRNMPYCMGSMYWQIDDCWPVASWSSIDYYGNWKALQYYAEREYRTFLISTVPQNNELGFYVVSDSLSAISASLEVTVMDFYGNKIYDKEFPLTVEADSSHEYVSINKNDLIGNSNQSKIVLIAQLKSGGKILTKNTFFFKKPKDLQLEKPDIKVSAVKIPDGYELTLSSNKFAKDVYLSFDKDEGFFTDNYFNLFPGEVKEVKLQTNKNIEDITGKLKIISLVDSY